MFTGIVQRLCKVDQVHRQPGILRYSVEIPTELLENLKPGASVSIDGACQTVVKIKENQVWFDAIQETLNRTTLDSLQPGRLVNMERAARFGDEIGGHILSGHIYGKAQIIQIHVDHQTPGSLALGHVVTFQCQAEWTKYLFSKGYIAIDGASLTLVDVDPSGVFTVHLIPETLRLTTLGIKRVGDWVNLEFDSQTQVVVETIERVLPSMLP